MPPSTSGANNAAPEAPDRRPRRHGLRTCVAGLVVAFLGLGAAGSVTSTGAAQATGAGAPAPAALVQAAGISESPAPADGASSRYQVAIAASRPASLTPAALERRASQRSADLEDADRLADRAAQAKAVRERSRSLAKASKAARHQASRIKAKRAAKAAARKAALKRAEERRAAQRAERRASIKRAAAGKVSAATASQSGGSSLPITSGYHIAARFGDTGKWSRYHTGFDFSAPIGTTVRAAASGVVTHAGSGSAGWAGRYVTIRHANGTSTLYAHLSSVSVNEGQRVGGGRRVGAVGMTGRTFGPHLHFEVYPAGVRPSNPYDAVNPAPWMRARGLRP